MQRKNLILIIFILGIFLALAGYAQAANHYIRDGANGDGSDWTNALDDLPTTFVRGDTYYIADGNYGEHTFGPTTGETSQYVTIKKAINTDYGNGANWQSEYGNGQAMFTSSSQQSIFYFTSSNWIIDGSIGSGMSGDAYGFLLSESRRTAMAVKMIMAQTSSTILKNLQFKHIEFSGRGYATETGDDIFYFNMGYFENLKVQNCYLHDSGRAAFLTRNVNDWLIENSTISRINSGETFTISTGHPTGYKCYDPDTFNYDESVEYCDICPDENGGWSKDPELLLYTCTKNQVELASPPGTWRCRKDNDLCMTKEHGESISASGSSGTNNVVIRNTIWEDGFGTGTILLQGSNWDFYNNIIFHTRTIEGSNSVAFGTWQGSSYPSNNINAYNNLIYNVKGINGGFFFSNPGINRNVYNNLWYNVDQTNNNDWDNYGYNYFINTVRAGRMTSAETDVEISEAMDIFENAANNNFKLKQALPGVDVSQLIASAVKTDFIGSPRGADGVWDVGAYEYNSGQQVCILGDLDCQKGVTITDIQIAVNVFLGIETDETKRTRANVDTSNPDITIADIQKVVNIFLNID